MAFRGLLAGALAVSGGVALAEPAAPGGADLIIADFNSGTKPNNLGGDFGAWIADPADPQQGCIESFERTNRFGTRGYSLRLIYSVDSERPAFGGLWMRLAGLDARPFAGLALRVRGDAALGHTTTFKVELKDDRGQVSRFQVREIGRAHV